jgi:ribosomal protein S18 acetylase RimI-like enzyme
VLEQAADLTPRSLDAIAELERQVVAADGGRLKLESSELRRRSGERIEDLLWWEHDRLVGFLGFYEFAGSLELAGMVAPDARRRGIATALLDAAAQLCRARGPRQALLVVPHPSTAGICLARGRGGVLDHSEHALVLSAPPAPSPQNTPIALRPASASDVPVIARLLEAGFGRPAPDIAATLQSAHGQTLVVDLNGSVVGTMRITRDGSNAGIYGFVIDPPQQGRGLGRGALRRACEQLCAGGARRIDLEVFTDNDRALGLYTSVGSPRSSPRTTSRWT